MGKKIHLIMPMGGAGSRFSKEGFLLPKPLIEINKKPFFYWATQSIKKYVELQDITFVVLKQHITDFKIDTIIKQYYPQANIIVIEKVLNGAVLTCLEGIKQIKDDLPIIFNDCDHMFLCKEFNTYCNQGEFEENDGALLTFQSNDPKFSYVKMDNEGNVIGTVEKIVVSNQAICGAYYFKNVAMFKKYAQVYLEECQYNEFFISGIYNVMTNQKKKIVTFPVNEHIPFGTPAEYQIAQRSTFFRELEE